MNAENSKLILKDIVYDISDASIYTELQDLEIILSLDIEAKTEDENIDYELSYVRLYHEEGFNTHTSCFKELKGKKFELETDPDLDDKGAGTLYVCEHEDITKGTIEIVDVTDDDKMTIHWSGFANVYWDDEYGEDVPFDTVFTVNVPQKKIHKMDLFKSTSMKINDNAVLDILNLEEFNKEIAKVSESRKWHDFNTILKFKVNCNDEEYFGEVIFENGKNNHATYFDEKCPIKVSFLSLGFNLDVNYEVFLFEIE